MSSMTNTQRIKRRKRIRYFKAAMVLAYVLFLVAIFAGLIFDPPAPWSWQR